MARAKRAPLRVAGHEHRMLRERVTGLTNRKQGFVEGIAPPSSTSELQAQYELMANLDRIPIMYFRNSDGTVWSPQNSDGTLVFPPGFDDPLV